MCESCPSTKYMKPLTVLLKPFLCTLQGPRAFYFQRERHLSPWLLISLGCYSYSNYKTFSSCTMFCCMKTYQIKGSEWQYMIYCTANISHIALWLLHIVTTIIHKFSNKLFKSQKLCKWSMIMWVSDPKCSQKIASQLDNLGSKVLHHSYKINWSTGTNPLGIVSTAEETVNTANWKLKPSMARASLGLSTGLTSLSTSRHYSVGACKECASKVTAKFGSGSMFSFSSHSSSS